GAELSVVGQFSENGDESFYNKIEELNNKISQHFANADKNTIKGGDNVEYKKFEEEIVETAEETKEEIVDETTKQGQEFESTEDVVEETEEATNDTSQEAVEEESFTKTFELSHDDIRSNLYQLLSKVEEEDDEWYYINEVYDNYFVYSSWDSQKYYKQNYVKTDVDVAFEGERVELFVEYLTAEELEELNKMRENYSLILKENEELKEFKAQKDKEEFEAEQEKIRQEKIDHINTEYEKISDDVKELFISKVDEYETVEDIDADICVYIVKNKVVFSKTKKEPTPAKVGVEENTQNSVTSPYGDLF
ncbi:hypothetical protein, partial [Schnuerera sp.]|uniref:hypothetical protein n=1 Tax=Schnuerera sp. TaxID=2794844 RepID=UPI002BF1C5AE